MSREAFVIMQTRRQILDMINLVYPSPMMMGSLCNCLISTSPTYDDDLLARDTTYLADKGYIQIIEKNRLCPLLSFKRRLVRLTARGKEIADRIISDPALEI